jgi:hypothetical protein
MSPDFPRHVAMVIVFGAAAVIWVRSVIWLWRGPDNPRERNYMEGGTTLIVFGPPVAAYFIIKDAW